MTNGIILKIGDREVLSTEIKYEDLIELYKQFIKKYKEVPTSVFHNAKHNMPQTRIINRILKENNITYKEFLCQFGKTSHTRTGDEDYDSLKNKYIEISKKRGSYLKEKELFNNKYGLPSSRWFISHCPNKEIKTFRDFLRWCGFDTHYAISKEEVSMKLKSYEKKINRPLTLSDITYDNVGFSMFVITRLYGNLTKAKEEIGLLPKRAKRPFEYYKNTLTEALNNIYKQNQQKIC